jgi:hypothetical protein
MICHIVTKYAQEAGLVDKLAPTISGGPAPSSAATSGWDFEQIQFLLGTLPSKPTERYLGSPQNFKEAVNDRLGLA